jgi:hypothetical protein
MSDTPTQSLRRSEMRALVLRWGIGEKQPSAPDSERRAPARRNASTRSAVIPLHNRRSRGANPLRAPALAAATQRAKTPTAAECEASQSGGNEDCRNAQGDAQNTPKETSHD